MRKEGRKGDSPEEQKGRDTSSRTNRHAINAALYTNTVISGITMKGETYLWYCTFYIFLSTLHPSPPLGNPFYCFHCDWHYEIIEYSVSGVSGV